MRAKSFTPSLSKQDKNKIVVKEPKIRLPKELREAAFGRKAGPMADKRKRLEKKRLQKELKSA